MIDELIELIWQKVQHLKLVWNLIWKPSKKFFIWKQLKKFIQYEKTLFTTNLKNWTYLQIMIACISILAGLFVFVYTIGILFSSGFFWTITLLISILLFRWANKMHANLDDEDRMLLKAGSGVFFIITLMIFLIFIAAA